MNVQVFDKLINDIRNCNPDQFNMKNHMTCILSFVKPGEFINSADASDILGIPYDDCYDLCMKFPGIRNMGNKIMPSDAVKVLENYKETGKVNWSIID
jgi:hypothetical protein